MTDDDGYCSFRESGARCVLSAPEQGAPSSVATGWLLRSSGVPRRVLYESVHLWVRGHRWDDDTIELDDAAMRRVRCAHFVGSSSSRTENSGVMIRECGYTR